MVRDRFPIEVRLYCILLSMLAVRYASYLRIGPFIIAFHIVDLKLKVGGAFSLTR